jgi:hypothetical protein
MTEREACERIVSDGTCIGVRCVDCPLLEGDWDCDNIDNVRLAEMWLKLHPCEKKLVFSAEKFYADDYVASWLKDGARASGWPDRADGKTKEECEELGFSVHEDWMEER